MLYMIIISGRAFPIGSTIPVQLTFMPLQKIKVFRLSAAIEGKILVPTFLRPFFGFLIKRPVTDYMFRTSGL